VEYDELNSGERIGGRYRLESHIGAGGMARVWRAVDETLERPVAVKFLYAADAQMRERMATAFSREARIAAAVRHPYVVSILDFGTLGGREQIPYMVMELLEGETLGERIERKGKLPASEVVDYAARVLEGLSAVHDAGIVHRDLKPENIYLQRAATRLHPKLLDFGISRSLDGEGKRRSALTTQAGQLLGTPQYMSPEQAEGEGNIDLRTDLYSLGVIMYEALTGRLPFEAEGVGALIVRIVTAQYTPAIELEPSIGPALSAFLDRALSRSAADRFPDAATMHAELIAATRRSLGGAVARAISVAPPGAITLPGQEGSRRARGRGGDGAATADTLDGTPVEGRHSRPGRRRARLWTAAAVAMIAAGAGGWLLLQRDSSVAAGMEASDFHLEQQAAAAAPPESTEAVAPVAPVVPAEAVDAPEAAAAAPDAATTDNDETTADNEPAADAAEALDQAPAKKHRRKAPSRSLGATFVQHKGKIGSCFKKHGGAEAPALTLRMALQKSGRVERVEVLPLAQSATALGRCIQSVAKAIDFGPQKAAITFKVPLATRVER